jgi:hypothetical protein
MTSKTCRRGSGLSLYEASWRIVHEKVEMGHIGDVNVQFGHTISIVVSINTKHHPHYSWSSNDFIISGREGQS